MRIEGGALVTVTVCKFQNNEAYGTGSVEGVSGGGGKGGARVNQGHTPPPLTPFPRAAP
jgi:hypothetical protein